MNRRLPRHRRPIAYWLGAALTGLSACTMGPAYERPSVAAPLAYKEAPSADSNWLPAAPADALDRGPWWELFEDEALSALMQQVEVSNQNVASAIASYAQAQALVRQERAALLPSLALHAGVTRGGGPAPTPVQTTTQLGLQASWEPDVWGQLRMTVSSAQANAQASAANLAGARLSAQAALANDYFELREADNELALLRTTLTAYERALRITQNQYDAGIAQRTDVLQAKTQLETTRASLIIMTSQRAVLEHGMALLVGKTPAQFSLPADMWKATAPGVPLVVGSELLQRRPDVAAAERAVAQANAQIGIQRTAYFPNLSISGSFGGASPTFSSLFDASSNLWSLGLSATQALFDAGATRARVEGAQAARDVAVANYRQAVLGAFRDVEDQLAKCHALAEEEGLRRAASADADRTEQLIMNQYLQGQVTYTSVVTAQVTALSARQALSQLVVSRQRATIALIQALGGGWHAAKEEDMAP